MNRPGLPVQLCKAMNRSINAQAEHWMKIGMLMESNQICLTPKPLIICCLRRAMKTVKSKRCFNRQQADRTGHYEGNTGITDRAGKSLYVV